MVWLFVLHLSLVEIAALATESKARCEALRAMWVGGSGDCLGGAVAQRGRGDSTEATPPRRSKDALRRVKNECFLSPFAFTVRKQKIHIYSEDC